MRLPVAVRLAVRDLARHQTRAAAALAATSLTLGIAATVIITVTAVERGSDIGNLSSSQMLITVEGSRIRELVTDRTPAEIEASGRRSTAWLRHWTTPRWSHCRWPLTHRRSRIPGTGSRGATRSK